MVTSPSRRAVTIAAVIYYPAAILLGWLVVTNANARSLAMERAAELQTLGSKASYAGNTVLETVTFGWYDKASQTDADYEGSLALAEKCSRRGTLAAWGLAGLTAAFCLLAQFGGRTGTAAAGRQAARQFCLASLVFFAVGVTATALSLVASREVTGLGTVVFGSGPAEAARPRGRGPTALSTSRRLSSSIVWPTSCRRRGSTDTATTGCLRRITSSGGPSRRWRSATSASNARP